MAEKVVKTENLDVEVFEKFCFIQNLTTLQIYAIDDMFRKGYKFPHNLRVKLRNLKVTLDPLVTNFIDVMYSNARETIELEQNLIDNLLNKLCDKKTDSRLAILQDLDLKPNATIVRLNNDLINKDCEIRRLDAEVRELKKQLNC